MKSFFIFNFYIFFLPFGYAYTQTLSNTSHSQNCSLNPCKHGICVLSPNEPYEFRCFCERGFTGALCHLDYDECSLGLCRNNATCEDLVGSFRCICPPAYTGELCEHVLDHCALNPCKNDGLCVSQPHEYKCICPHGFTGRHCENDVRVCPSVHCKNNGTCVEGTGLDYHCVCTNNYSGRHCENPINPCETSPCQNGGQCLSSKPLQYTCSCLCGWAGKNCEYKLTNCTKENDLNCENGGICRQLHPDSVKFSSNSTLSEMEKHFCYCKPGFTGKKCEKHFSKCLKHVDLCENGGKCRETDLGYACNCLDQFQGTHCEIDCKKFNCSSNNNLETVTFNSITPSSHIFSSDKSSEMHFSVIYEDISTLTEPESTINPWTSEQSYSTDQIFTISSINPSFSLDTDPISSYPYSKSTSDSSFTTDDTSSAENQITSSFYSMLNSLEHSHTPSLSNHFSMQSSPSLNADDQSNIFFMTSSDLPSSFISFQSENFFSSSDVSISLENSISPSYSNGPAIISSINPFFSSSSLNLNITLFSAKFSSQKKSRMLFMRDPFDAPLYLRLQFEFFTIAHNGLLIHARPEMRSDLFALVYVQKGKLFYAFSCNTNKMVFIQSDHIVNNGHMQKLQIQFKLDLNKQVCLADLSLNDSDPVFASQKANLPRMESLCIKYFQFGQLAGENPLSSNEKISPFDGCIQNIEFNGKPKFAANSLLMEGLDECNKETICLQRPCRNEGKCEIKKTKSWLDIPLFTWNSNPYNWSCSCPTGSFGKFCELATCDPSPCQGESTCLLSSPYEFNCLCSKRKFGKRCEFDLNFDAPKFNNERNSFMVHSFKNNESYLELRFNFSSFEPTQSKDSILLFIGQNYNQKNPLHDFLLLTINEEVITLKLNLGKGTKEISVRFIRHENLHEVRLGHSQGFMWLSVDNYDRAEDELLSDHETLNVEDKLYIAGHKYSDGIPHLKGLSFFTGCLFNLTGKVINSSGEFKQLEKVILTHNVQKCDEIHCR